MTSRKRHMRGVPPIALLAAAAALAPSAVLAAAEGGDGGPNRVEAVRPERDGTLSRLTIALSRPARFTVFKLDGPTRVVIDVAGCDVSGADSLIAVDDGRITRVMTSQYRGESGLTGRVMVGLAADLPYDVKAEGAEVVLTVRGGDRLPGPVATAAAPSPPPASVAAADPPPSFEPPVEPTPPPAPPASVAAAEPPPAEPSAAPAPPGPHLADVSFDRDGDTGLLRLTLSEGRPYRVARRDAATLELVVPELSLPAELRRRYDTTAFETPVREVRVREEGDGVRVAVALTEVVQHRVRRAGDDIEWTFEATGRPLPGPAAAAAAEPQPPAQPQSEPSPEPLAQAAVAATEPAVMTGEGGDVAGFAAEAAALMDAVPARRRYSGKRISIDLKDADIHNVLRLIADVSRLNVITSDDVRGAVTIRVVNVPWDQALDIILKAKGLGQERHGNIIRVAPLEVLQDEREAALAQRDALKELDPLQVRLLPVNYATAGNLVPQIGNVLTKRGSVEVDERTNVLIIKDVLDSLIKAEQLVKQLDTETPQVLIEARIIEARRNFRRELGVQWGGNLAFTQQTGNPTGIVFPSYFTAGGGAPSTTTGGLGVANPNFAVNLPAAISEGEGGALGLSFGSVGGSANLNLRLSALENNGVVRIISSPKIATLDNKPATIKQGIKIPVSTVSAAGTKTIFIDAVLQLQVTPHITPEGGIILRMEIKRDEPDFTRRDVFGQPAILTTESETELLIKDGDTSVIGGIFQRTATDGVNKVPLLGDIPILGWFFKKNVLADDRTELLIFITPRILNRAQALITPQ